MPDVGTLVLWVGKLLSGFVAVVGVVVITLRVVGVFGVDT